MKSAATWTAISAVVLVTVAMATGEQHGKSNSDDWSYVWYDNKPFSFIYTRRNASDTTPLTVEWETPSNVILKNNANTTEFELIGNSQYHIDNAELLIKKITPSLHGVYICRVYLQGTRSQVERKLFGINIRYVKHDSMREEYRDRLIVAGIASGVFLVPLITACVTLSCRYEERHGYEDRKRKYEMSSGPFSGAEGVDGEAAGEADTAYDNPSFTTPM